MKLLLFEFICSGGYFEQPLPSNLYREGHLMLQQLLRELESHPDIQIIVPLDPRVPPISVANHITFVPITNCNVTEQLGALMNDCDAIWPVAPETDNILSDLVQFAHDLNKPVLASSPSIIKLCTDKYQTLHLLQQFGLNVVPTEWLNSQTTFWNRKVVLKPNNACSCDGSVITEQLTIDQCYNPAFIDYIIQPYFEGRPISLSCLFNKGSGWLISCNEQRVSEINNTFSLSGCQVNIPIHNCAYYEFIIESVGQAIPDLWGYIGIDLIELSPSNALILELNPRLTTSYCGIESATGINIATQTLRLFNHKEPNLVKIRNETIDISLSVN